MAVTPQHRGSETAPITRAPVRVLLVEDVPAQARLVREYLAEAGGAKVHLEHVDRLQAGLARLESGEIDVLLLDLDLPDSGGFSTLAAAHSRFPELPIIVFTGVNDEELGDRLVQTGAQDYLVKGQTDGAVLFRTIRHALERSRILEELRRERNLLDRASNAGRVALWEWNLATDVLEWHGATGAWFQSGSGFAPASRREWELRIHADDRAAVRQALTQHLGACEPFDVTYRIVRDDGLHTWWHEVGSVQRDASGTPARMAGVCIDVTERKRMEIEREELIGKLQQAVAEIRTLSDLLPICSWCKKIRDDQGYWNDLERYFARHSGTRFTHGLCPDCARKHYPEIVDGAPPDGEGG